MQMHGAVVYFRNPEREQPGRGQQQASAAVVGDAPTASSAEPKPLSKRKQRSAMRLAEFRRQKELRSAQLAAARLKRLWSVVWLQRLVRRWMGERRLAAGSARARWTGADAGLRREVQAEGLEERLGRQLLQRLLEARRRSPQHAAAGPCQSVEPLETFWNISNTQRLFDRDVRCARKKKKRF